MTDDHAVTVVKLGGSCLRRSDFHDRFRNLPLPPQTLLLVGGGEMADVVREWDVRFGLDVQQAHSLAIATMDVNAQLVANLVPSADLVVNRDEAESAWRSQRLAVLKPTAFLQQEVASGASPLPIGWHVTSDAIAAWVALRWPASRLLLAKMVDCPETSAEHLADTGLVDPHFAQLAPLLPAWEWVNFSQLESDSSPE